MHDVCKRTSLSVCLSVCSILQFVTSIPILILPSSGQVSAQRAVLTVQEHKTSSNKDSVAAFIEEAVVRRELAENFCYYNQHYDSVEGAPAWAQETLRLHAGDKREVVYSEVQLEEGITDDPLWNAAQVGCLW